MANWKQAPFINGQGEAVATNNGWENPRTGEVLACHAGLADKLDAEAPKKAKPAASKSLTDMTKDELETYAKETYGVDLDKRKTKTALVEEIEALA